MKNQINRILGIALLFPAGVFAAEMPETRECHYPQPQGASLFSALACGKVNGSIRTLYYSTHNANFVTARNQDTVSYGGSINYETADYYGFSAGISGIFVRGIDHPDSAHTLSSLADNQTNVGEAWLRWHDDALSITAGDQRVNLPFVSDYDWRITPILFRGVDAHYGDKEDFLHASRLWRYKPWGSDRFQATSAYTNVSEKTDGMWAAGLGRTWRAAEKKLSGQLWYENYQDYARLFYSEGRLRWLNYRWQPDIGLQFIRGTGAGREWLGEVDSTSYGIQFSATPLPKMHWDINYDHIASHPSAWNNGSVVVPYAHSTSSGPWFAQPYFTSTEDLGSGNAYSTNVAYSLQEALKVGARYSFMDLKADVAAPGINQSEYMVFFTWFAPGIFTGFNLSDYAGVQTSSRYKKNFWQNRLTLKYDF
ncbi:OprD family outer membrane porin [Klebsiella sp. NPDC088457]